jgi:hypothetical protein
MSTVSDRWDVARRISAAALAEADRQIGRVERDVANFPREVILRAAELMLVVDQMDRMERELHQGRPCPLPLSDDQLGEA